MLGTHPFFFFNFYLFFTFRLSIPEFIVYAAHPVLHVIHALHNTHHQAHPTSHPFAPKPSDCLSESIVSHGSPPLPISLNSLLLSISPCPPCYLLCSTNKWNHMIIDSLCLTYFTQHNLFQSRPCCYKSWVFILSDGGIILHQKDYCRYGPYLLYPFICWRASWLFPQFGNCGHCCYEHWGTDGPSFSLHLYLWGKYPVVQLQGHRVAPFLIS